MDVYVYVCVYASLTVRGYRALEMWLEKLGIELLILNAFN